MSLRKVGTTQYPRGCYQGGHFCRWFPFSQTCQAEESTQQQQEEIKVAPPLKGMFSSVFSCLCRNQFYPSQHQAPEPDLPRRLEDGFFQLQPRGAVERWLPDWWVSLGGWRGSPLWVTHDLAGEGLQLRQNLDPFAARGSAVTGRDQFSK